MTRFALLLISAPLLAQDFDLQRTLEKVEKRYNAARTIQVPFQQTYAMQDRPQRTESGMLYLRKPGKMRWSYADPAGKVFLSDGKHIFFYSPSTNRVEKSPVKETDDVRVPLAFLLGKLDFSRDFGKFIVRPGSDGGTSITAIPKSDKMPYQQVEFVVTPDFHIRRLIVNAYDHSQMDFRFGDEKMNLPLDSQLFVFKAPPGVDVVEISGNGS